MIKFRTPKLWLLTTAALIFGSQMSASAQSSLRYQSGAPTMVAAAPGLPSIPAEQIARDVTSEFNPRTGLRELVAAPFDPFEEDPALAGSLRLRSLECSTRVENVVYDHNTYYDRGYARGIYRPYRHYAGHSGFGFGFGNSYYGPGYGYYGSGRSYRDRGYRRSSGARRGTHSRVLDAVRNRDGRAGNSQQRNLITASPERPAVSSSTTGRAQPRSNAERRRDTTRAAPTRRETRQAQPRSNTQQRREITRSEPQRRETRQAQPRSNAERRRDITRRSEPRRQSNPRPKRTSPPTRRISRGDLKQRIKKNFFPDGGYGGRSVVSSRSVDCAREDKLRVFIPNERLDAARFDGLTLIAFDAQGGEAPIYLPPNYIEGYRLAASGQVRPQGISSAPQYAAPPVSLPPQTIEAAPCPHYSRQRRIIVLNGDFHGLLLLARNKIYQCSAKDASRGEIRRCGVEFSDCR